MPNAKCNSHEICDEGEAWRLRGEMEASRVARSESFEYGSAPEQPRKASIGSRTSIAEAPGSVYALTGHGYALWTRATEAERLAVVRAFGSNRVVERVEMVNALVSDALGQAWGEALQHNTTLTTLNLESNAISTRRARRLPWVRVGMWECGRCADG